MTPQGGATFNGHFVPEGVCLASGRRRVRFRSVLTPLPQQTVVSMSQWMVHRDEDAFPDPMTSL